MTNAEPTNGGAGFSATDLNELERQLAAWRAQQQPRGRLPEELWKSAAALAQKQGVSGVARALRLDYYSLRRWCDPSCPQRGRRARSASRSSARASAPRFVELKLEEPMGQSAPVFRVELADGRGARMSFELGREVAPVVALAEVFWKRLR